MVDVSFLPDSDNNDKNLKICEICPQKKKQPQNKKRQISTF